MKEEFKKYEQGIALPDFNFVTGMYQVQDTLRVINNKVVEALKPVIDNYSAIQETMKNYYSVISSLSKTILDIQGTYRLVFSHLSSIVSSIDFKGLQERLDEARRKKIAYCLKYDIYPPLLFLDELMLYGKFENQLDADEFLKEHIRYWNESNNKTVYDFIPLSLRTYHEINQLKQLELLGMYKLMVIYCCERIEYILSELQIREQGRTLSELQTSQQSFRNFINTSDGDDEILKKLITEIAYISEENEKGYKEINLFKRFNCIEETYEQGVLPLNRNLFLHGRVKDAEVSYLMVQKAILAYAFFEQLFVLKSRKTKDIMLQMYKRKGISKKPKYKYYHLSNQKT